MRSANMPGRVRQPSKRRAVALRECRIVTSLRSVTGFMVFASQDEGRHPVDVTALPSLR
jgi:hypothetical protein